MWIGVIWKLSYEAKAKGDMEEYIMPNNELKKKSKHWEIVNSEEFRKHHPPRSLLHMEIMI